MTPGEPSDYREEVAQALYENASPNTMIRWDKRSVLAKGVYYGRADAVLAVRDIEMTRLRTHVAFLEGQYERARSAKGELTDALRTAARAPQPVDPATVETPDACMRCGKPIREHDAMAWCLPSPTFLDSTVVKLGDPEPPRDRMYRDRGGALRRYSRDGWQWKKAHGDWRGVGISWSQVSGLPWVTVSIADLPSQLVTAAVDAPVKNWGGQDAKNALEVGARAAIASAFTALDEAGYRLILRGTVGTASCPWQPAALALAIERGAGA